MQTSVIGFPRVGELRELKFATEKFFKGLVSEQELEALAKDIRKKQWLKMQEKEVDFIPSNDFSFYDNFLDAAVLFNIIPERYRTITTWWRRFPIRMRFLLRVISPLRSTKKRRP